MEGTEGTQQLQLVLGHKRFLLSHPVQDIKKGFIAENSELGGYCNILKTKTPPIVISKATGEVAPICYAHLAAALV